MNILLLTHRLPFAPNRGDRIRAYHLIRALARSASVHLVSLVHDDDEWSHRDDLSGITASTEVVRVSRARNLISAALALPGPRPLTHVLLHTPAIYPVLRRRLALTPPDVVVAYCSGMARYACEPVLKDLPFVLDLVDVDSEKWRELAERTSGPRRWIFRRELRLLRRFEIEAVRRARATTVASERERRVLQQMDRGLDATAVPNGIDLRWFAPATPPATAPRVVFCGVFNYAPNEQGAVWFARQVWPSIVRARPDARLSLVGMEPTAAVRSLGTDPTIEVTGAVPDVREYLWRAAIAVAPIAIARGIQNKAMEAAAAGLPSVVTTAVYEGLPAAAQPACLVANDPATFSAAVIDLMNTPAAERRAIAARADLRTLSWETQLAPLVSFVEQAAKKSRQ